MSSEVAVRCEKVGKAYRLYDRPEDRLKELLSFGRRTRHRLHWAVRGVDLEIRRGESVAIVGRNGAGKSTLLQMICGTLSATEGTVRTTGRIAPLLALGAGFNPEFTGLENVRMNATLLGLSPAQLKDRLESILDFAEIGAFVHQPVRTYSTGMQSRLAFAVAAHTDADVLIVDETLAVGDAAFVRKCMRFIRGFLEHGTMLFVSHSQHAVLDLCDRAVWLHEGRLQADGPAKSVCHAYAAFLHQAQQPAREVVRRPQATGARNADAADHRAARLKASEHRNIGELAAFSPDRGWWGVGGLLVEDVWMEGPGGAKTGVVEGGEVVTLRVRARASEAIERPVFGFVVRNGRGQVLFGDNTFVTYADDTPPPVAPGGSCEATFRFRLPYLATGDYTIEVATASGTVGAFTQHQWVEDALTLRVRASHVVHGLVGVPLIECRIDASGEQAAGLGVEESAGGAGEAGGAGAAGGGC